MSTYNIVAASNEETVVTEYRPQNRCAEGYQSEADLERALLAQLAQQGYEYLRLPDEPALVANLRAQLEALNAYAFSDAEWARFFNGVIARANDGIAEKTRRIQTDHVQVLTRDDGTSKNIRLIDKQSIHNNRLQVINQYEQTGTRKTRYDVTVLVNGIPLVHIELKRRGVAVREAFNQINRYGRDSFWAGCGLFDYVQVFVISNGTQTKYYANTVRERHLLDTAGTRVRATRKSHSFEFTSHWADARNRVIADLTDFGKTFFARHTLLNILTRYCVFTAEEQLLVMRPYQIVATERILNRVELAHNYKRAGSIDAGGYIWHTTGSGKTLTSFKTAQLVSALPYVDKVLFVVDRKDLDYQTMKEYDRFQKGAANGNTSTRVLQRQMENEDARILITTIQKLERFITANPAHAVYNSRVVLIFDECHRSQFGEMHRKITRAFKKYHLFGFTGTPIFAANAAAGGNPKLRTTAQAFGEKLHTYTIVDAIRDNNVLPFRIDYVNTVRMKNEIADARVPAIDIERALAAPERVANITGYILDHFDQKTKRSAFYTHGQRKVAGFNSLFATASVAMAKQYYEEFHKQLAARGTDLAVATIFSYSANEDDLEEGLPDEGFELESLDASSRDFLERAIADYNRRFQTNFDTSADKFQNYYKDLSQRVKNREVDLLIVVNMFLTGFDATTLNTLWVDKNLRLHGLIQAFSRTNRVLNAVKKFGNIVCFRDLKQATDDAIALFGDREAGGIVLLKTYDEYYNGYEDNGKHQKGYTALVEDLRARFAPGELPEGEQAQKEFIRLFGAFLRLKNILTAFDEFEGNEILPERDEQDYRSVYIDLYRDTRRQTEKENINDDIVFEMELIRQQEVNIDYILMLVAKYHAGNCEDTNILATIRRAVNASVELRSKKELIEGFVERVNLSGFEDDDWQTFVREQKEQDLSGLIESEHLKPDATRRFLDGAFRDGTLKTTGTDLDRILPPVSRFSGARAAKKQSVIEKLLAFFEKYLGLG